MSTAETASDHEQTGKFGPCGECRGKGAFYQKQIRRLREKLEYSELQNFKLVSECDRLRGELRDAEFRGRSSMSPRPSPILPDEILRDIFSRTTHVQGGLVSPHWRVEDPYVPWVISSQARRSIPLVCRQWYLIGLEYLYQHIVIFTQSQLRSVLHAVDYFPGDPELHATRLGWVRGLEFITLEEPTDEAPEFMRRACALIRKLSQGRLRLFGFEDGTCHWERPPNITEILADALHKAESSLEMLHLPCIRGYEDRDGRIYYRSSSRDFDLDIKGSASLSKLQVLSLTSGRWEVCGGLRRSDRHQEMISFLTHNVHSIHTVYLNWIRGDQDRVYLNFLRNAIHLQTIHIFMGRTSLLQEGFDDFLDAVPKLRRLVLTISDIGPSEGLPRDAVTHQCLEEIDLLTELSAGYKAILMVNPIFFKVRSGHLPNLKRVVVHGPYPEGCIDNRGVLSKKHAQCWRDAIAACAEQEVDLMDERGNAIQLWEDRHSIRFAVGKGESESDASSSEGGEWWEISSSDYMGSSVADDDIISNDSDDSPYRYVSQPDLDYDSESEGF